jgi:pimeloyl-ACP methyl ester carboxylesterase
VHARELAAALPDCVGLTELPGVGHMTPMEAPELVSGKIRALAATYIPSARGERAEDAVYAEESA